MSSDEEIVCVKKKKVVVADSSDENETLENKQDDKFEMEDSSHEELDSGYEKKSKKKQRRIKTLDSSSESESENASLADLKSQNDENSKLSHRSKNKTHKSLKEFDSTTIEESSDDEEEYNQREIEKNEELSSSKNKSANKNLWYKNTDLYDAEGSSEEEDRAIGKTEGGFDNEDGNVSAVESACPDSPERKQKKVKKREERKSKKKAQEDIKTEIHKESQRLLREVPVSIPYHRPKQRSLAEFLVRRKSTTKVPLRTSSEQLINALREIEQREKEAELFYKSESSDEETELKETPHVNENNLKGDVSNGNSNVFEGTGQVFSSLNETDLVIKTVDKEDLIRDGENSKTEELDSKPCNVVSHSQISDLITEEQAANENVENEKITQEKLKIVNVESVEEENILGKELGEANSSEESEKMVNESEYTSTSEGPRPLETNLEDKIEIVDSVSPILNNQVAATTHTESNLHNKSSSNSEIEKSPDRENVSSNVINTEEFSLKLSESLSEYTEVGPFQNCVDENRRETNTGNVTDKGSSEQEIETDGVNQLKDKVEVEGEESATKEQSSNENYIENELYKKYNVDVKSTYSFPKITGSHDEVIDLGDDVPKPEVNQLMKRFFTHLSYKKKPAKKKMAVELSVVEAKRDGDGNVSAITEELVQVLVGDDEEDEDPALARPGAKLARLRAQLQQQMERHRDEEWAKRQQEQRLYEDEVFEGEKDVCDGIEDEKEEHGDDKDETEEEEEEEVEDEEESENEDDESEEEMAEKKRKSRNFFLDDEAEESDEEPYTKQSYKSTKNKKLDDGNDEDDDDDVAVDVDYNNGENISEKLRKIDDSNVNSGSDKKGSNDISDFFIKRPVQKKPVLQRTRTTSDMFSTEDILKYSTDDDELPSFQKPRSMDEKEDIDEKLSQPPSIVSPAFQLTALENMDGPNRYNWSAPSTPCKDFLSPRIITPVRPIPNLVDKSPQICTQELENLCSGNFASQPLQEAEDNAQDFELFLADDSQLIREQVTPVKTLTTVKSNSDGKDQMKDLLEDDEDELAAKMSSKKAKKLNFSDDEDDGDDNQQEAEAGVEGSDEASELEDGETAEVEYDSEENEMEAPKVAAAGEFLDVEAELSEEEWSSEDEDERGLDALEMEEADKEKIDQRRLKRQLDQIHMREMLKEDKKQVKLLQEMLLEDGELHSENKRQRLFRWSNNAAFNEGDNKAMLDSDEEKVEEDENEEAWRKSRHEREVFLQEQSKKTQKLETLELEDSDSQLLKLGQKALKRLNSSSQESRLTPPTLSNPLASPDAKKPFALPKRGSFLSRGQQALSRLAQLVSSSSDGPIQQPKNSRNFVFTSISPTKSEQKETKSVLVPNKRKIPHLPLPIAKKPCVQKPKTANKKSLFEALRVHS